MKCVCVYASPLVCLFDEKSNQDLDREQKRKREREIDKN